MTISKNSWLEQHAAGEAKDKLARELGRNAGQACGVQQGTVEVGELKQGQVVSAQITPLDDSGRLGNSTSVDVHSISGREIAFHHPLPLKTRHAFVSVHDEDVGSWEALVDLSWCRFNRMGHYTSGGRFVQPAARTA